MNFFSFLHKVLLIFNIIKFIFAIPFILIIQIIILFKITDYNSFLIKILKIITDDY